MSLLTELLSNKPISEWQREIKEQGRDCPKCGVPCVITAPATDSTETVRIHCENCGYSFYEFKPAKVIEFPRS